MPKKSVTKGFRWCPHCGKPHPLADRVCAETGRALDALLHRPTTASKIVPAAPAVHALVGTVLDQKYRVLRSLGGGGMGVVFEAEHITLKRLVAIKIVARPGSAEALERLALEAQLVAGIHHPNICDVYDVGRLVNGGPYVVLERLFGETLAAHMRLTPRPHARHVIDLIIQVLSGLHAAHSARIIDRDIKPQNLFLADRLGCPPIVKILDFGFAQDLQSSRRITQPGNACGTVPYMSPEQLRAAPLDHRSDLFAVGVIMYEMLAGRHPFSAPTRADYKVNILRIEPRPLRQWRPELSPELDRIVMGALAKDPNHRASSAYEMQNLLSSAAEKERVPREDDDSSPSSMTPIWIPPSILPPDMR